MSVVDYRRHLHRIPELDNQLPETTDYIRSLLEPLGCKIFSPITGSVCAWFDAGKDDSVAFRADLDALPVPEQTGLPFASVHPGVMHACGHDGHTAMVLALAEYVSANLSRLPRNVLLIFQPSEETTAAPASCVRPACWSGTGSGISSGCTCGRGWRRGLSPPGLGRSWPGPTRSPSPWRGTASI